MKRFWWLLPTLAVLVGAFLLPDLLLSAKEKRMESRVFASADVTPTWQGTGASLSMGEKLALIARQDRAAQFDFGAITDDEEIRDRYYAELDTLKEKNLISSAVHEWLLAYEAFEISRSVLLDADLGESLSVYRVQYYDGTTYVLLDTQTYKVIYISLSAYEPYAVDSESHMLNTAYVNGMAPDWAEYYGAEQKDDYGTWLFLSDPSIDYYLYAQRFTVDGESVGFSLHYSTVMQLLTWRIETPENAQWILTGEFPDDTAVNEKTP